MKYSSYDLGHRKRGETVEVSLSGSAANVLLLDSSNYSAFRAGRRHRYIGGLAKRSPIPLTIPSNGHWYVVIHMAGLRGTVRQSIRMLPSPLPEIQVRRQPDLSTLIRDVAELDPEIPLPASAREFDVFISHATEDKDGVVRALAHALDERDIKVWYDEFELRIGDSLRRKIDSGLARSRFGLVVVSHAFFAKGWPQYELDGLVTLEMACRQRILPVWHEISKEEVMSYSPSLADKVALSTALYTADEIAEEIAEVTAAAPQQQPTFVHRDNESDRLWGALGPQTCADWRLFVLSVKEATIHADDSINELNPSDDRPHQALASNRPARSNDSADTELEFSQQAPLSPSRSR